MSNGIVYNVPKCKETEIYRLVENIVSTEGETKQAAMGDIRRLKLDKEFLIYLMEIASNSNLRSDVSLFASAELKKHIEAHWCSTVENFVRPEIDRTIKTKIKELLLTALSRTANEVREAVASMINTILRWEWPHDWPALIETLVECLNGESENGVHGALLVLNNFDPSPGGASYMPDVLTILRVINRVFASENYSQEIRCLACKIFSRMVSDAAQNKDPHLIQRYLQPAVSSFCAAFVPNWTSGIGGGRLKIQILHTVSMLMGCIPKCIADFLPDVIHLVWGTLIDCAKDYQVNVVNRAERNRNEIDLVADEAESCSTDLVKATLKFIKQLMDDRKRSISCHKLRNHEWISLQDSFIPPHALRHLIMLMEVPDEQIEQSNATADDFAKQEQRQELENDGIRSTAQEIIEIIRGENRLVANNLIAEIMKYLEIEQTMRLHGQTVICHKSWKSLEAFLLAFILMKNIIISQKDGQRQCYDVESILRTVVLADLNNPASHPLLVGRCLNVGGMYAGEMSKRKAAAFIKATVARLQENQPVYVKIHAAKAARQLKDSINPHKTKTSSGSTIDVIVGHPSATSVIHIPKMDIQ